MKQGKFFSGTNITIWVMWLLGNAAGFTLGDFLGGQFGVIRNGLMLDSRLLRLVAELTFGLVIGLSQLLVLRSMSPTIVHRRWAALTMVGFFTGGYIGKTISFAVTSNQVLLPIVFGVIMGSCVGIAQVVAIQLPLKRAVQWLPFSVAAWVIGEILSFSTSFRWYGMPLVGVMIACVLAIYLRKEATVAALKNSRSSGSVIQTN